MSSVSELAAVAAVGLLTTSSNLLGAAVGLSVTLPRRLLASMLAFAAGSLISALAIELAFENAHQLRAQHFTVNAAWLFVGGGFALGAVTYYTATRILESRGAAVRLPSRFREYATERKRHESIKLIGLLSQSDLLRHLPPGDIEELLRCIRTRRIGAGEILFRTGDEGDALFIVVDGRLDVVPEPSETPAGSQETIATLGRGQAFGEMALLSHGPRTATIRAETDAELLEIGRDEFHHLMASDPQLAAAVRTLSHDRALSNLDRGAASKLDGGRSAARTWARVAGNSVRDLSRGETDRLLSQAGRGAGLAIVLGNILDTIPGCLVIGAKFEGLHNLSIPLMAGMFLGGIPEAAASAAMLRRAEYGTAAIFGLWSTVLVAGIAAAVAGRVLIGSADSLVAIFSQAVAGGAVLALVTHAMLPEAIHEGGSIIVLPTVGGFLFALYLVLMNAF